MVADLPKRVFASPENRDSINLVGIWDQAKHLDMETNRLPLEAA